MSMENLLRKFFILNHVEGSLVEEIVKDPWMNMGHGEELTMPSIESSLAAMTLGSLSGCCPWATRVKGSRTHRWARG